MHLIAPTLAIAVLAAAPDILTVAELSDYEATATHAQVVDQLERLAAASPRAHLTEMGRTVEGRSIPLLIVADPPVASPADLDGDDRIVVLAFGAIHAGEVCGKEALVILARELLLEGRDPALFDDIVLLLAPIYNADGNDRMAPDNRPGQVGPVDGMGERPNTQGLDLNRDWTKLEAPETRAMVRAFTNWQPHLVIDTHTTNGSHHRYTLTYAAPLNPSGDAASIAFVRDELLPTVTTRLRERTGYDTFFYGNFNRDHTVYATYSANPRFGGPYRGLRGQMSILSEAYAYATYRDRVLATLEFVREILRYAAERDDDIRHLAESATRETIARGRRLQPDDCVGLRHRPAAFPEPAVVRGYEMTRTPGARPEPTTTPKDHHVIHVGRFEPTVCVRRPAGYLIPPGHDRVVETLRAHGITVEDAAGTYDVETYTVTDVAHAERAFQGHRLVTLEVTARPETIDAAPGAFIVPTAQALGTLAVYLLEPQATDGLAAWNFFDEFTVGATFPVRRLVSLP